MPCTSGVSRTAGVRMGGAGVAAGENGVRVRAFAVSRRRTTAAFSTTRGAGGMYPSPRPSREVPVLLALRTRSHSR